MINKSRSNLNNKNTDRYWINQSMFQNQINLLLKISQKMKRKNYKYIKNMKYWISCSDSVLKQREWNLNSWKCYFQHQLIMKDLCQNSIKANNLITVWIQLLSKKKNHFCKNWMIKFVLNQDSIQLCNSKTPKMK